LRVDQCRWSPGLFGRWFTRSLNHWCFLWLTGLITATCVNQVVAATSADQQIHRYELRFAQNLRSVDVRVQLAQKPTANASLSTSNRGRVLTARNGRRSDLRNLRDCSGGSIRRAKTLRLPPGVNCFMYTARLRVEDRYGRHRSAIQTSPSTWLWIPALDVDDRVWVDVHGAVPISVPWSERHAQIRSATKEADVQRFEFGASPESSRGLVVLGDFLEIALPEVGLRKPMAYVGPEDEVDKMTVWLAGVLEHVASVGGRLPNPNMQVIVWAAGINTNAGRSPVPFGHVIRDQGETVRFFVDARRSLADLRRDWTAAHEFAHVFLPYVQGRQKWISEGFASYYQNVLQARAGEYSEQEVWQRLTRSFARAAEDGIYGSPNQTSNASFGRVRMMIYWSGAAIALHGDARLRALTNNEVTLDSALKLLADCCLPSTHTWQGRALFAKLDELTNHEVFLPLYERFADAPGMPDTARLMARLGVNGKAEAAWLSNDAEWTAVRRAIMNAEPAATRP